MRALNHVLLLICNISLASFVVEPPLLPQGHGSVAGVSLKPVTERYILTTVPWHVKGHHIFSLCFEIIKVYLAQVSDEESSQFRALSYLAALQLRVCPCPDSAHSKWGDFNRAIDSANLRLDLLKGTCIVNHGRGPYGTHGFGYELQEAASHLLETQPDEYFLDIIPRLEFDFGMSLGSVDEDQVRAVKQMWAEGVALRLKEVPLHAMFCSSKPLFYVSKLFPHTAS